MADEDRKSMGQAKDLEGARGRRISEQQDVGALSAQNRGGTTDRSLEESKRLEEDDREQVGIQKQSERTKDRALAEELQLSDECKPTGGGEEASNEAPDIGNTAADEAARDALNRPTESFTQPGKRKGGRKEKRRDDASAH